MGGIRRGPVRSRAVGPLGPGPSLTAATALPTMWTMNWLAGSPGDRRSPEPGGYDRSGAWVVDHAVRALATGCAERYRHVPPAGAVVLGPESLSVRLTTPDEAPPPSDQSITVPSVTATGAFETVLVESPTYHLALRILRNSAAGCAI